jgi:ABC-type transport system involved in multi-copper enzyme maturation permease subunit
MKINQRFSVARCAAVARAEFRKVWASHIPLVILLALPVGTYLFVFELYHLERVATHLHIQNALDTLPIIFLATWKTLLFQIAVLTFAAFWTTVDSQYGMIRVACCQPITRVEYLIGKWCGISLHVAFFVIGLVASELAWTAIYSGLNGVGGQDLASVGWFAVELVVFVVAFSSIAMAISSARQTVGAGIVMAMIGFVTLAFMTIVPFDVLPPRFVFMRYFFFPLGELRSPLHIVGDSPYRQLYSAGEFYRATLLTPVPLLLAAIVYFRKRDIVE